ncbi:MAG: hypothetical protein WAU86_13200 [Oricola sp.]
MNHASINKTVAAIATATVLLVSGIAPVAQAHAGSVNKTTRSQNVSNGGLAGMLLGGIAAGEALGGIAQPLGNSGMDADTSNPIKWCKNQAPSYDNNPRICVTPNF